MGHMAVGLNHDIGLTGMAQSKIIGSWIHLKGGVMTVDSILVLVQRDNVIITATIHIGEVRRSTCQRSSRNQSLLHLMDK